MPWDPAQYLHFAGHRLRAAVDLLNRIDADAPEHVYDLGSGAGNVTALLKQRWPKAEVTGVENSGPMLERAAASHPEIDWQRADLATWTPPQPADVIYSNAALHWLGDHSRLFPRLLAQLRPGGTLAVQMPRNFDAPSHTKIAEAVRSGPWRTRLEPLLRPPPVREPAYYLDLLRPEADEDLDIWETAYLHVLQGPAPVKEWTKGTSLVPLLEALEEPERTQFEERYSDLLEEAYPRRPDGSTLFPFRRLFIVARRRI